MGEITAKNHFFSGKVFRKTLFGTPVKSEGSCFSYDVRDTLSPQTVLANRSTFNPMFSLKASETG